MLVGLSFRLWPARSNEIADLTEELILPMGFLGTVLGIRMVLPLSDGLGDMRVGLCLAFDTTIAGLVFWMFNKVGTVVITETRRSPWQTSLATSTSAGDVGSAKDENTQVRTSSWEMGLRFCRGTGNALRFSASVVWTGIAVTAAVAWRCAAQAIQRLRQTSGNGLKTFGELVLPQVPPAESKADCASGSSEMQVWESTDLNRINGHAKGDAASPLIGGKRK